MTRTDPRYKWVVVALLFCIGALNYGDRVAVSAVFPLVRSEFKMSDVELAAVGSFFLWAYALASPFGGMLADRVSRSRVIVWSLAGWSMVMLLTGFVTSTHQLLTTRVLLGLAEAAFLPTAAALIADYHRSQTRGTALGLYSSGISFGVVAGGFGTGYMGDHFGWRSGFLFLGIAGLLLALVTHFLLHDAPPAEDARGARVPTPPILASLARLGRTPSYLIISLAGMIIAVGTWIFLNWLPLYFKETYQMSLAQAGFAGTFMLQSAGVIALITGGMFSDRFAGKAPRKRVLIQAVFWFTAAPFLLVFFGLRPELMLLYICMFMFSFLLTFGGVNTVPLTCDLLPRNLRSTGLALANTINCLAGGAGIMLAGFLKSRLGLGGIFGAISIMTLIAAGTTLICYLFFVERDLARRTEVA